MKVLVRCMQTEDAARPWAYRDSRNQRSSARGRCLCRAITAQGHGPKIRTHRLCPNGGHNPLPCHLCLTSPPSAAQTVASIRCARPQAADSFVRVALGTSPAVTPARGGLVLRAVKQICRRQWKGTLIWVAARAVTPTPFLLTCCALTPNRVAINLAVVPLARRKSRCLHNCRMHPLYLGPMAVG